MIGVLINDIQDIDAFRNGFDERDDVLWLISDKFKMPNEIKSNIQYFFAEAVGSDAEYEAIVDITNNWYRDKKGLDLIHRQKISVGPLLARRLLNILANTYRNFAAFSNWMSKLDLLYVPDNEAPDMLRIAKMFSSKVKIYFAASPKIYGISSSPERTTLKKFPLIHPFSKIFRNVQIFFSPIVRKKKILHFRDWTSESVKSRNDMLFYNHVLPWKGFYIVKNKEYKLEAESIFPENLILDYLKEHTCEDIFIRAKWPEILIDTFRDILIVEYKRSRQYILRAYKIYRELFEYYSPALVTFPGETHYAYVLAMQILNKQQAKSMLIVDGYPILKDSSLFYKDLNGENLLFSYVAAYGDACFDLYRSMGVDEKKLIKMKPPLVESIQLRRKNLAEPSVCDALILFPQPSLLNPQCRWDFRFKYVEDVVNILSDLGLKTIGIKIKGGDNNAEWDVIQQLEGLMCKLVTANQNLRLSCLRGDLYQFLTKTELVVGQVSTSIIESFLLQVPYYIYEPVENGVSDEQLYSSTFIEREVIARTAFDLKNNISEKKCVSSDLGYLFNGESIQSLHAPFCEVVT